MSKLIVVTNLTIILLCGCASVEKRCANYVSTMPVSVQEKAFDKCLQDPPSQLRNAGHALGKGLAAAGQSMQQSRGVNCQTFCNGGYCNTHCQ